MSGHVDHDWDPGAYHKFRGLRLRPAMDLLAQVPDLPKGDVIDLGCGNGAVGGALTLRFAKRRLIGVDNSPAMLAHAKNTGSYADLTKADASTWVPDHPPALIFSNALCHWLPDHTKLFTRLSGMLTQGGTLAVQMPNQYAAPSHALLRGIAANMYPDRFDFSAWVPPVAQAQNYGEMLAPLGMVNAWFTEYIQRLDPVSEGHPVRHFTGSTAMRPFLEKLTQSEATAFTRAYDAALFTAYPVDQTGHVLFAFRRVFFILTHPVS